MEIKRTQAVASRDLRSLRDFIAEHDCSFGLVINNDEVARAYDERIIGIPFHWL